MENIKQLIITDDYPIENQKNKFKEIFHLLEHDEYFCAGTIVAAIMLDDTFVCWEPYVNLFNEKYNIKEIYPYPYKQKFDYGKHLNNE